MFSPDTMGVLLLISRPRQMNVEVKIPPPIAPFVEYLGTIRGRPLEFLSKQMRATSVCWSDLEPLIWIAVLPCAWAYPASRQLSALLCFTRLSTLGPEGAVAMFFAGQSLAFLMLAHLVPTIHISVLATTAVLSSVLLLRARDIRGSGALLIFASTPFLVLLTAHIADYSDSNLKKVPLVFVQVIAGSLVAAYLGRARFFRLSNLVMAIWLCNLGAAILFLELSPSLFSRNPGLPAIDIARQGGLAAVIVTVRLLTARNRVVQYANGCLLLGCIAVCFQTLTRQAIIAVPLSLILSGLLFTVLRMRQFLLLCGFVLISLALFYKAVPCINEQATRLLSVTSESRPRQFRLAWNLFLERPVFGHGLGAFGARVGMPGYYPHNVLLEVLADFGIVGLAACALMAQKSARIAAHYRLSASPADQRWVITALLLYWLLVSLVSYSLPHSIVCAYGVGLLSSSRSLKHTRSGLLS